MNSVQERLRHWRTRIEGISLRELRERINAELPDAPVSLGTLSNYERRDGGGAGPRAEFLAALKRAFPAVRLDWLVSGEGRPTELAERLASPDGLEARADRESGEGDGGFARRVLERHPDLELLSPEASTLFMAALTRLAMGEPDLALDEDHLLDLAADLRWLLLCPLGLWGFCHEPGYEQLSDYAIALLHALMLLMPPTGQGESIDRYASSLAPTLRRRQPVGFAS